MSNLLSQFTKLRPYNIFVCLCEQVDFNPPIVLKVLYNDFKVNPEFNSITGGPGLFEMSITNFDELGLKPNDACVVNVEPLYVGAAGTLLSSYLNLIHDNIYINSYLLSFASNYDINGQFMLIYAQLK